MRRLAEVASVAAGQLAVTTGAVVSTTSKLKETVLGLPVASVADAKIVCCPMANVSPEATGMVFSLNVTGTAPFTASIAEAANVTGEPAAEVASVDAGAPAATTGAVVSFTSKPKLVFAVLPATSVADARTVWLPTEKNVVPGVTGVAFSVKVTGSVPSIASLVSATKLPASRRPKSPPWRTERSP